MANGNPRNLLRGRGLGSIKSIFAELGKVNWPSLSQTLRLSLIVIALSGILALILGLGVDSFFTWLIGLIGGQNTSP